MKVLILENPVKENFWYNMIKAVLFDVDGVLVDSEKYIDQAAIELFATYGAKAKIEDFEPFVGTGEKTFLEGMSKFYGFDLENLEDSKKKLYSIYEKLVIENKMTAMHGAVRFLKNCKKAGLKIALATSADITKLKVNLKCMGFASDYFDAVVDATQVIKTKPFPYIYLTAAYRMGVLPENCVVIEDAVSGLRAARRAGCQAIGIFGAFDEKQLIMGGADFALKDLASYPSFSSADEFNEIYQKKLRSTLEKGDLKRLFDGACSVINNAYAPYSNYKVGAAILTEKGNVYCGCNVENASFGGTICAERNAATTAIACEGKTSFKAIVITSQADYPAPPCAICRQFLCEFMDADSQVFMYSVKSKVLRRCNFGSVMPDVFDLNK